MAVNNIVKRLQNIMRQDAGINGDAQRIEQMTWMFFLKVYDTQEETWEYKAGKEHKPFESIIPEELRWRNWAVDEKDGNALTGDALLTFINDKLFPTLKGLEVTRETPRSKAIVKEVFEDLNQYMKNGILLRQVINVINEIEFDDAEDRHMFGDIYEGILKDLQSAGNAGEFYTPRALTDFIIQQLNPVLGETVGDFTSGTGGFLTSALNYLQKQVHTTDDGRLYQQSVIGQEWKPLPYLLSITNLLLHDVEAPNIRHCDSLGTKTSDFKEMDKVNGLMLGADDYVTKPFSPSELAARVDAICRRISAGNDAPSDILKSGPFTLSLLSRTLTKNGKIIDLTQVEFQLMELFMSNAETALERKQILVRIWGESYNGDDKIVDVNIRRLRMKIEDEPSNPAHLQTVWGYGYKWMP